VFVWTETSSVPRQIDDTAVQELVGVSPDGTLVLVVLSVAEGRTTGQIAALPRQGGAPRVICPNCFPSWAPGGEYMAFFLYGADHRGKEDVRTVLVELPAGESLPAIPEGGVARHQDLLSLPGIVWTKDGRIYPGPRPDLYAYASESVQRNIFRIPLPGE
jgi:hypothetical protein